MAKFTDFQFVQGDYGRAAEYTDDNAIVLAIRNIILSKPGNFPFNPSVGMNIKQYQFDLLDDTTISNINDELRRQIAMYIPDVGDVKSIITKVEDENGMFYLGISIGVNINGEGTTVNFILGQDGKTINVYNEIH